MKRFLLILGFLIAVHLPSKADALNIDNSNSSSNVQLPLKGGFSPHGKYEIRVIGGTPDSDEYAFGFFKPNEKTPLFQAHVGGGFYKLGGASEIDTALWNDNESLVAIQDHGSRHSMEIYLLYVTDSKVIEVPLPKFGKAVLEKMADIHGGAARACICTPLNWKGSNFTFRFDGGPNTSNVTVKVIKSETPHAIIVSETPPKEITQ